MHIHPSHLQSNQQTGREVSGAAAAARRSEVTRKRLLGAAAELQTFSEPSPWLVEMTQAWAGGSSGQGAGGREALDPGYLGEGVTGITSPQNPFRAEVKVQAAERSTSAGPVSVWA
jgi:hypothetical protein